MFLPIRVVVFPVQTVTAKTASVPVPLKDIFYQRESAEVKLIHMGYLLLYKLFKKFISTKPKGGSLFTFIMISKLGVT